MNANQLTVTRRAAVNRIANIALQDQNTITGLRQQVTGLKRRVRVLETHMATMQQQNQATQIQHDAAMAAMQQQINHIILSNTPIHCREANCGTQVTVHSLRGKCQQGHQVPVHQDAAGHRTIYRT